MCLVGLSNRFTNFVIALGLLPPFRDPILADSATTAATGAVTAGTATVVGYGAFAIAIASAVAAVVATAVVGVGVRWHMQVVELVKYERL